MSWRDDPTLPFDPHAGRNAFKGDDEDENAQTPETGHPLARTARAMRSFTESIDTDVPPAPELPESLDIDKIGMRNSDTNDTIIEVRREDPTIDHTLGETQKFKMAVPGPGHTDQETELHKSLLREDSADDVAEAAIDALPKNGPKRQPSDDVKDHASLRQQFSVSALTRPRATTPTQQCMIESSAFIASEEAAAAAREDRERMKVTIPAGKRRRSDMSYSEFYDSMSSQMPGQARRSSQSGRTTPLNDYEGDILEENPEYRSVAPPKPVVHRRTSVEWENFEEQKAARAEQAAKIAAKSAKSDPFGDTRIAQAERTPAGFDDSFYGQQQQPPAAMDDSEPEPEFSEDMAEERERFRKQSELKDETTTSSEVTEQHPEAFPSALPEEPEEQELQTSETEQHAPQPTPTIIEEASETPSHSEEAQDSQVQPYDDQYYDYSQYPGWNPETQQFEGTYIDENGDEQSYAEYYAHYFSQQPYYDESGNAVGYETAEGASYQAPDGSTTEYYEHQTYYPENNGEVRTLHRCQLRPQYDAEYYNSEEYRKWYEENYGPAPAAHYNYDESHDQYNQQYEAQQDAAQHYDDQQREPFEYSAQPEYSYEHEQYQDELPRQPELDETHSEAPAHAPPPPRPPAVSKPVFEAPPPKEDEFGWDAAPHEAPAASTSTSTAASQTPTIVPMHPSPSRPPPPTPERHAESEPPQPAEEPTEAPSRPPPARPPPAARPPPPRPVPPPVPPPAASKAPEPQKAEEPEEDAWAQFKKMTEKVSVAVKSTEERLKDLSETTAAKDIRDESYIAQIGGSQGYQDTLAQQEIRRRLEEKKQEKLLKKKMKNQGKRAPSPEYTLEDQERLDKASEQLAQQIAAKIAMAAGEYEPPRPEPPRPEPPAEQQPIDAIPPRKKSSIKEAHQESSSLDLPSHAPLTFQQSADSAHPIGDFHPDDPALSAPTWADFESAAPELAPSESGFFGRDGHNHAAATKAADPFAPPAKEDPFAPADNTNLYEGAYDPFDVRPVEDIVAAAKAKADAAKLAGAEHHDDMDYFGVTERRSTLSTPTPEGGSPISARPTGFEDDFKCERASQSSTPSPLYDEDDSQPLDDFIPRYAGEGWELMIRHPLKKKIMADRFWKPCFVRIHGNTLIVFNSKTDNKPIQELLLQASYSLSDTTLQAYDVYGKIHTVKLQFVQYKERVGIRPGQISRLVEGHVTKYGLPLEHSAQCNVLLKFGSLNADALQSFVSTIEDLLFKCPAKRDAKPVYKQDEVQIHCYDEYSARVDKLGVLSDQKARVRMFCLAFVTGSPFLEIGLNDRRRQGKEIVRRKDILPMYTERWIRFENLEFHNTVDQPEFEREQVIRLQPPDGCFFEVMRFRIRPPKNREKALTVKCLMKIAGSKVEIRMEAMAAAQAERSRGGKSTRRQIPCEDIVIRFPIPEAWIYIFREERHWGVGSVHSKKMRPGKVKNLKDRLLGAVQTTESNLIEVAIGEAKYEHVYRSLVWRIPRLPEKHHAAYKSHLLKCRFELSSFDLMPETFLPNVEVDFTMPLATVSNTVVRSVSVEQHEDSDRVEKFVRYVAKCKYKVEIDYVQCADLDVDATLNAEANPEDHVPMPDMHQPAIHPSDVSAIHDSYRIDLPEQQFCAKRDDSSSDEDEANAKFPTIQIDMSNYGY